VKVFLCAIVFFLNVGRLARAAAGCSIIFRLGTSDTIFESGHFISRAFTFDISITNVRFRRGTTEAAVVIQDFDRVTCAHGQGWERLYTGQDLQLVGACRRHEGARGTARLPKSRLLTISARHDKRTFLFRRRKA
jgi:hypothetical protein